MQWVRNYFRACEMVPNVLQTLKMNRRAGIDGGSKLTCNANKGTRLVLTMH
jgi:hypothetical protein